MANPTPLSFGRDLQGYNSYAPQTSTNKYSATLALGVESHITVPSSYPVWVVGFSMQPGTSVWVDLTGGTAVSPSAGTLAATTSELNPGQRTVLAGTKISMITDTTTADVSVMLWPIS